MMVIVVVNRDCANIRCDIDNITWCLFITNSLQYYKQGPISNVLCEL